MGTYEGNYYLYKRCTVCDSLLDYHPRVDMWEKHSVFYSPCKSYDSQESAEQIRIFKELNWTIYYFRRGFLLRVMAASALNKGLHSAIRLRISLIHLGDQSRLLLVVWVEGLQRSATHSRWVLSHYLACEVGFLTWMKHWKLYLSILQ